MPSSARSLAEDLRFRTDGQLQALLRLRPPLAHPVPRSFADLAIRANSPTATVSALDDLTTGQLAVLEAACALAAAGRFGTTDLAKGLGEEADSPVVAESVDQLLLRALLWGGIDDVRVASAVREAMGRYPCGLDDTARSHLAVSSVDVLRAVLREAPPGVREQLGPAIWDGPVLPSVTDPIQREARTWLIDHGYVITDEQARDVVPREVALPLRNGQLLREPSLEPPETPSNGTRRAPDTAVNGHAADQFLRSYDRVHHVLTHHDFRRQINGALAIKDWERLLSVSGLPAADLAIILELAWSAETAGVDAERVLRPTVGYRHQAIGAEDRAERWAKLAVAWLHMARLPAAAPDRALAVDATDAEATVRNRTLVMLALHAVPRDRIETWLAWHRPRSAPSRRTVNAVVGEADILGLSLAPVEALTSVAALTEFIEPTLPALTDRLVLQADLTATALGPLVPEVEQRLQVVADRESGGAAAVYRFSSDSIVRGLVDGLEPPEILAWLESIAATPVPQALAVMIADAAASKAKLTVTAVQAVISCDPGVAEALLADPRLADLGLRLLEGGTVVADVPARELAARLRDLGQVVDSSESKPAPVVPTGRTGATRGQAPSYDRIVSSLRQVEQQPLPTEPPPTSVTSSAPSEMLERLAQACAAHTRTWLVYSDDVGARQTHLIEPLSILEGEVCAFDVTAGDIRMIPVSRIMGIAHTT